MLRRSLVLAALAGALAAPSAAHADAFDDVFADYQKDGRISPCAYTPETLERAQGETPRDIRSYAPEFPGALKQAIERRADANCPEGAGEAAPATPPPATTPPPAAPAPAPGAAPATPEAAPVTRTVRRETGDAPAPRVVLAVLGGLVLLALLAWGLLRGLGLDPRWLAGARHATAESGWRVSAAWADFVDWLRGDRTSSSR